MMNFYRRISKINLLFCLALLPCLLVKAQTDMDAIMMNKSQFCSGFMYNHSRWNNYWEGALKRNNENLGTVTTQSVMYMANYGITNKLNIMAGAPYVWTKASAGTLHTMNGIQDISMYVKWIPFTKSFGKNKISVYAIGGFSTPLSNYVVDFQPLAIGLGTTNFTGRGMVDYRYKRMTITVSAAYLRRSNVKLDRTSYYDTELHLTNEVKMPDAAQFQLRTGYRGRYVIAEALLTNWTTLGGFDISRNNMPFPSNRMNATTAGLYVKYTLKSFTGLSFLGAVNTTLSGRNIGQSNTFTAGAFYAFYFKKNNSDKK